MTKLTNPQSNQPAAQGDAQSDAANAMNSGFMKWFFPLFSLWICATSNAAFSIYWMAVNIISIIQSVALNRYFDRQEAKLAQKQETK